MGARLKSSVLRREERGIGSITMGRLIASAMLGGIGFMAMRILGTGILMIPGGLVSFVLALVFTGQRYGIPLYRHLWITFRARLLLHAHQESESWQATLVSWLNLDPDGLTVNTVILLSAPVVLEEGTLDEWEIVPDSLSPSGFEVVTDTILTEARHA
jgi:hypothetical protein